MQFLTFLCIIFCITVVSALCYYIMYHEKTHSSELLLTEFQEHYTRPIQGTRLPVDYDPNIRRCLQKGKIYEWDDDLKRYTKHIEDNTGTKGRIVKDETCDQLYILVDDNLWVHYPNFKPHEYDHDNNDDCILVWDYNQQDYSWMRMKDLRPHHPLCQWQHTFQLDCDEFVEIPLTLLDISQYRSFTIVVDVMYQSKRTKKLNQYSCQINENGEIHWTSKKYPKNFVINADLPTGIAFNNGERIPLTVSCYILSD